MRAPASWLHRPRIRVRLAFSATATLLVVLVFVGYALAAGLRDGLRERAHESLEVPFRVIEHHLAADPTLHLADILNDSPTGESQDEVIGQQLDAAGTVLDTTGQTAVGEPVVGRAELDAALRDGEWHEARRLPGRESDDIVVVVPITRGVRTGEFVVLAQSLAAAEAEVDDLLRLYALLAPALIAVSLAGGWWIAGRALQPVDVLTRQAAAIDAGTSDATLPVPVGDDEISRLAEALNAMLVRLRNALERQRQFSADASHELRSPLAVMTATLEVHLRAPDLADDTRALLVSLHEDAARLSRIVEDLLVLSRAESGGSVELATTEVDLLDLAVAVAGRHRSRAEARGMTIGVGGEPALARVDAHLFTQALVNLVDNAVKFGGPGGRVDITVGAGPPPSVTVADDGPGIAAEDAKHVFERFFRADRARSVGGSGLGLAIVRTIVAAHGGSVTLDSPPGQGARFTIRLPEATPDATAGRHVTAERA